MEYLVNKNYVELGKVLTFNQSDGITNMVVETVNGEQINIKVMIDNDLIIDHVYEFKFTCTFNGTRNQLILNEYKDAFHCHLTPEVIAAYEKFYSYVAVGIPALKQKLEGYLASISNPVIKGICEDVFARYEHDFLIYPAAVKMHHNYIGGLAYHTLTMCDLAKSCSEIYECVDQDYLIAGALLHDISKIIEFAGPVATEYSLKGQLLGHLVLGAMEIEQTALRLGYKDCREVLLLQHMIVSHHGQPQYGACKRPETPEALLLWMLDNMDSKMRVVDETLANLESDTFSENIAVIDRSKVYKK